MDTANFTALLARFGISAGEISGQVAMIVLFVSALKKAIEPLRGHWCLVAAGVIALALSYLTYSPNWQQVIVATLVSAMGAAGAWQLLKDTIDRAHGKDTNEPLSKPSTREGAGL